MSLLVQVTMTDGYKMLDHLLDDVDMDDQVALVLLVPHASGLPRQR